MQARAKGLGFRLLVAASLAGVIGLTPAAAEDIDYAALARQGASAASAPVAAEVSPQVAAEDQADYVRYVHWQRDYSRRGWEWHLFSTQLLFAIVLGIVAFGLWVTYQQFRRDYTGRRARAKAVQGKAATTGDAASPPPDAGQGSASKLKIGPEGLELTSQVVGLFVLAMSLAFFFFYVKEVYPMREVARGTAASQAESGGK